MKSYGTISRKGERERTMVREKDEKRAEREKDGRRVVKISDMRL